LDTEAFEAICRRHTVRLVYLTPHHQFPTTRVMRPERRLRLLGLAEQFRFAIVEDDYDHEFHFSHQPLLPLASIAPRKTVYIGSMSKLLTPSIRLGYVVAPTPVIERMAAEVLLLDRQGDPATELAIAGLIDSGEVNRHARKSLQIYARRRQLFSSLLRESIGGIMPFEQPEGGLAFWIDLDDRLNIEKLNQRARQEGIQYLPPDSFAASPNPTNRGLRLGFASLNETELAEATRRLAIAVRYATEGRRGTIHSRDGVIRARP
jgi:GntR family transcriptional regulator/MocR family aminotransferase